MTSDTSRLLADFRRFHQQAGDVVEGALLVSRLVDPETDIATCRAELLRLAEAVGPAANANSVLTLFRAEGFRGAEVHDDARHSALSHVLRTRRGIPISMAACLLGVARLLDIPAQGINFPGHFLISLDRQLVDPFNLLIMGADERARRLAAAGVPPGVALRPAGPRDIVLRMLNNLRGLAQSRGDAATALELTDYQAVLAPEDFGLRMLRAELYTALGVPGMARHEWSLARDVAPDPQARAMVEARLGGPDRPPERGLH